MHKPALTHIISHCGKLGFAMDMIILIAGGRITCLRCTARSCRTGLQCGRPALKASKTQKCQFHGGRGSGPKTLEGKAQIAAAHTRHGEYSKDAKAAVSARLAKLSQFEDVLHVLKMTSVKRSPGRKPLGYKPVRTIKEACELLFDTAGNKPCCLRVRVFAIFQKTHHPGGARQWHSPWSVVADMQEEGGKLASGHHCHVCHLFL